MPLRNEAVAPTGRGLKLSWADHRMMEDAAQSRSEFTRMPGGGLLLKGPEGATAQPPGFFAGLSRFIPERFRRTEPQAAPYWIPQPVPVAAREAQPVVAAPGLPAYNAWSEIEDEVNREARIVKELGDFSKRVLADERLVGKER